MTTVTIVLPTYNRPQHLDYALRSVLAQNFADWKLLVVGDACAADTEEMVQSFNDPRIFYINLKERCGEQSGPISAGSACATTPYIAYIHHDDLWFSDHLESALAKLQSSDADLFAGQAAFTTFARHRGRHQPAVNALSPTDRTLSMAFYCKPTLFEPTSSWVIKRELFQEVGPWEPAGKLIRTPAEDWLLRAWRAGATMVNGDMPTTIYCNAEKRKWVKNKDIQSQEMYSLPPEEQNFWWAKISRLTPQDMRGLIRTYISNINRTPDYFGRRYTGTPYEDIYSALLTPQTADLFKQFGWDAMKPAARLSGRKQGDSLTVMLKRRTGEALQTRENWDQEIQFGAQHLQSTSTWFEQEA